MGGTGSGGLSQYPDHVDFRAWITVNGLQIDISPNLLTGNFEGNTNNASGLYPTLREGDTGVVVGTMQKKLVKLGYLTSSDLDGRFGPNTELAVEKFQKSSGLQPDGVVGADTWKALNKATSISQPESAENLPNNDSQEASSSEESKINSEAANKFPILREGDGVDYPEVRNAVEKLQVALGFPKVEVDGKFGGFTDSEVRRFQKNNGLVEDGIVGESTWEVLLGSKVNTFEHRDLSDPSRSVADFDLDKIIASIPAPNIRSFARDSVPLLLEECVEENVTDIAQIAYVLATAEHESHLGEWMEEFASGQAYEFRSDLGNTEPGDGPRYKGRGFVQLTGRRNYKDWSNRLGLDLLNNPNRVKDYPIAAKVLVIGMRDGTFTDHKLNDYINNSGVDFIGARRIINSHDRASQIADIAGGYLTALQP